MVAPSQMTGLLAGLLIISLENLYVRYYQGCHNMFKSGGHGMVGLNFFTNIVAHSECKLEIPILIL